MKKRADAYIDFIQDYATRNGLNYLSRRTGLNRYVGDVGNHATTIGSLAGLAGEAPTLEELDEMERNNNGWIPGNAARRTILRRKMVNKALGGRPSTVYSEEFGPGISWLTTTLGSGALGAATAGGIAKAYGRDDALPLAGMGAIGGLLLGGLGGLAAHGIGSLSAALTPTRTDEEQRAYEEAEDNWKNWLIPGRAIFNKYKSLGVSNRMLKEYQNDKAKKKKEEEEKEKMKKESSSKLYEFEKIAGIQPYKDYLRNPKYQFEKIAAGGIASSLTRTPFNPPIKENPLPDYMQNQLNNMPNPSVDREPITDGSVATTPTAAPAPYTLTAEERRLTSANTQRPISPATSSPMNSNQTPGLPNNSAGYTPIYTPGMPPLTLTNDTALPFSTGGTPYPMQQNQTPYSLSGPNVSSGYNFSTPGPVYTSADGRSQSGISETNVRNHQQYIQNGINSLIESYNKMDEQGKRGFMGLTQLPQGSPYNSVLPYAQEEIRRRGLYPGGGSAFTGGPMENIPYGSDGGNSELAFYNDRRLHAKTPESREFAAQQYGKMLQDMNADRLIYRQNQQKEQERIANQRMMENWGRLSPMRLREMGFDNPQDWYSKTPEQRREWFKQRQDKRLADTKWNIQNQFTTSAGARNGDYSDMQDFQQYKRQQEALWGKRWRANGRTQEEIDDYINRSYKHRLENYGVNMTAKAPNMSRSFSNMPRPVAGPTDNGLAQPPDIEGPPIGMDAIKQKAAPIIAPIKKSIEDKAKQLGPKGARGMAKIKKKVAPIVGKITGAIKDKAQQLGGLFFRGDDPDVESTGEPSASPAASGASTSAPLDPRVLKWDARMTD